jgi:hypothetical protein
MQRGLGRGGGRNRKEERLVLNKLILNKQTNKTTQLNHIEQVMCHTEKRQKG